MERKINKGYFLDDVTGSIVWRSTFVAIQRFSESLPIILANTITVVFIYHIIKAKINIITIDPYIFRGLR
jgi:hypothetical protein